MHGFAESLHVARLLLFRIARRTLLQIQDGFIVGIFNYCDRRCEACAFTSRCRLFAMMAKFEAQLDPGMRAVADSPSLSGDPGPGVTGAVGDMLDALDEAEDDPEPNLESGFAARPLQDFPPEFDALRTRSDAYREQVWTWLRQQGPETRHHPDDPLDIVTWSAVFLAGKMVGLLAIQELTLACGDHDGVADGSAKWCCLLSSGRMLPGSRWSICVFCRCLTPPPSSPTSSGCTRPSSGASRRTGRSFDRRLMNRTRWRASSPRMEVRDEFGRGLDTLAQNSHVAYYEKPYGHNSCQAIEDAG